MSDDNKPQDTVRYKGSFSYDMDIIVESAGVDEEGHFVLIYRMPGCTQGYLDGTTGPARIREIYAVSACGPEIKLAFMNAAGQRRVLRKTFYLEEAAPEDEDTCVVSGAEVCAQVGEAACDRPYKDKDKDKDKG